MGAAIKGPVYLQRLQHLPAAAGGSRHGAVRRRGRQPVRGALRQGAPSEDGQQPAADGDPHQAGVTRVEGQGDERVARRPVDCGVPSWHLVYHAHFSYPHGTSYGARTTFVCLPPAKLQGASAELRCQEDGLWSLPEAYCQLTCRAPPPMANAVARTDRCKHDGQEVGSSCKYRCEPGHHVPLTSRKGFKVRCTDSGHWEEGGCVPVQCPPLPPVLHGSYTCTQRWQLGSRCWVNCSTASASK
ncbi:pappalysin-1-like, partial [Lethenteron reissneri]|uniref:pappalysin-1-like n=1 Tax=Lethenteron reissneri TaxID=7753 RepID=UPI002AB7C7EA